MPLAVTTSEALDVVLAIFLIVVGLAIGYAFWKLGVLFAQLCRTVRNTERVNKELDKVDVMTDSAVEAVTAIDRAVRAVSAIVTAPVEALAGLAAAVRHGVSSFVAHRDVDEAVRTAKDAGARRMTDLAEELDQAGRPGTPAG
jgi:hypothetical protein